MVLTAAAGLVGTNTAVRAGFAIARAGARALGRFAGRQMAEAGRAVACAVRGGNSFVPETPVVMADGTTLPIDQIQEGDLVSFRAETVPARSVGSRAPSTARGT